MAKEQMYFPDEEYNEVYDDEFQDMKDEDTDAWYADEFPDDSRGDEFPDESGDGSDWRDEDFMDYRPARERKAS